MHHFPCISDRVDVLLLLLLDLDLRCSRQCHILLGSLILILEHVVQIMSIYTKVLPGDKSEYPILIIGLKNIRMKQVNGPASKSPLPAPI